MIYKSPLVSVIIPTYNRDAMVSEAVASVFEQTFKDFELIVVDDGSTDGTASLLSRFGSSLRPLQQEHRGVSAARNRGVAEARGELIAFLDSDDLWLPEKLAVQVSYLRTFPRAALCHTEEIWLRRGRRVNPRRRHAKAAGKDFVRLLRESLISPSAVLIRRPVLEEAGGFDESLPACEDYALWLKLARTHEIHLIDRPLVIKRGGHPDQLSRRLWGLDRFRVQVLRELASDAGLPPEDALEVRRVLEEKCRILAEGSRKRGRATEAEEYLRLAGEAASCDR
jgi:glycosyltransferase involved in cell wall biosynthesis